VPGQHLSCGCLRNHSGRASQQSRSRRTIPTNIAAAKIAVLDFNKITSLHRPAACGYVRWGSSASQSTASNASAVVIGRKKSENI